MLKLKNAPFTKTKQKKKLEKLDIHDFSDLSLEERTFRRTLEWGAAAISLVLSALALYLIGGVEVLMRLIT
ncbi:hypothetical protein [Pontibacter anaerobius]|uniref:Preprotein translocase subunit SecE n=1 Tax=Pontibacter anaerobius TaxID=2993940 RepID=A0ABT3RF87_9BACT|nr:hypothetical protein [Pontibacter anaerobius]MCX2740513.1 hypothetical protein [Pontibacter anaerobius]